MGNFWLAFITGLTTGGLSCFAVQGGLLTSALASEGTGDKKYVKEKSILMFLLAKLIAYSLLGFVLGFLGSEINISPKFQGTLQIFVGIYMLLTAARLLNLHPIFRYLVIQPPKSFVKLLKRKSEVRSSLTPALLGFLTVLIPCGITQAMLLLAIGTGSPVWGASIMFFFILGTSPVFFLIGLAATELLRRQAFSIVAAVFIAVIGILAINTGQILRGSVHTLQNYWSVLTAREVKEKIGNIINIEVTDSGYQADINTIKAGVPVKLILNSKNVRGCAKVFTIPDLNIFKILPQNGTTTIEFTPARPGRMTYTCSMGMYSGYLNVIE